MGTRARQALYFATTMQGTVHTVPSLQCKYGVPAGTNSVLEGKVPHGVPYCMPTEYGVERLENTVPKC